VTRRWLRRAGNALVVLAAAVWIYFVITLVQVSATGRRDDSGPVDAIVVMGAAQYDGRPSSQLAARLDHVVTLWEQEVASVVVVTGGKQPGDRFTEAEASAAYLTERGVPAEAILLESQGRSTYQSLDEAAELLADRELSSVVVVTDPYHSLRTKLIAEEFGLTVSVSPTPTSVVDGRDEFVRQVKEAGGVAVGRLIGFGRLSDITG
jgi:uncharacterized SAM-binding protein YcdF (DUF218 family)